MLKNHFPWANREIPERINKRRRLNSYASKPYLGPLKDLTIERFKRLYFKDRKSLRNIAENLGCHSYALKTWIKYFLPSAKLRDRYAASANRYDRDRCGAGAFINEAFFSRWTREMAYVLGWIYTDGCLIGNSRTGRPSSVSLALADLDHVRKIANLLDYKGNISVRSNDRLGSTGRRLASFRLSRKRMIDDLVNLGLVMRKSLTLTFPAVPTKFLADFIRGCWEGDGSYIQESEFGIKASFISGSHEFVLKLESALNSLGLDKTEVKMEQYGRKNPYYCLRYFGKNVEKMFKLLYKDTPLSMRLDRKYEIINNGVEKWRMRQRERGIIETPPIVKKRTSQRSRFKRIFKDWVSQIPKLMAEELSKKRDSEQNKNGII